MTSQHQDRSVREQRWWHINMIEGVGEVELDWDFRDVYSGKRAAECPVLVACEETD